MARHSFSTVLYLSSCFTSFRLRYSTGRSSPSTSWAKTAPSPLFDVSVCKTKGRLKFGVNKSSFPHKAFFTSSNASWHCSDLIWGTFSGEIHQSAGQVRKGGDETPVIPCHPQEWPHLSFYLGPRVGCYRICCGCTLPPPKWYPKYHTSLRPITHFLSLAVSPACLNDSRMAATRRRCCGQVSLWMICSN